MEKGEPQLLQNKYEIVSKIKQGGFGIVYYGFDRVFEKPVAIKAIDPKLLDEARFIDLFLKEAKNAAKLSHNNIVHIYDLVQDTSGQYFIIMEYIEGYDLSRVLRQLKIKNISLPADLAAYVIKEICKALEYAHNKRDMITNKPLKLVHQDLSPSNIMVSLSGQIKLIDFGLAKIRFNRSDSDTVSVAGKLPYLAPEQVNGGVIDRRTDIFSLGSVFYEIVAGNRLVNTKDAADAIQKIKKAKINKSVFDENDVPEQIQNVIIKMLQKSPEDRYFGANGVYLDLMEFLMGSTHTVELSDELGAYISELYADDFPAEEIYQEIETIQVDEKPEKEDFADTVFEKKPDNGKSIDKTVVPTEPTDEKNVITIGNDPDSKDLDTILSDIENEFSDDAGDGTLTHTTTSIAKAESFPEKLEQVKVVPESRIVPDSVLIQPEEEDSEDDLKTVIDVIRLSAKTHSKKILYAAVLAAVLVLALFSFDILFQVSPVGTSVYNQFFPPAIRISSVPEGAIIYLDAERVPGKTPVSIPKIQPGIHELTLTYAGFGPIVKSIQVPEKGNIQVLGETAFVDEQVYLLHFKTQIELNSDPLGGTVYLNGIQYPQKTPVSVEWETGKPLAIEMEYNGYDRISGLAINSLEGTATIEDNRLWAFEKIPGKTAKFSVEGNFKKFITIETLPKDVVWYVDRASEPSGRSSLTNSIALSSGTHEILFKKQGYNDKLITLNVDENVTETISVTLDRMVHFSVKESGAADSTLFSAVITKYVYKGRVYHVNRETPCEISIPADIVDVYVSKEGYEEKILKINQSDTRIIAELNYLPFEMEIIVRDALTGLPVKDAEIVYSPADPEMADELHFGKTDKNGLCKKPVRNGIYNFTVSKNGYFEKKLIFNPTEENDTLEFKLIIQ